jgi:hypothetical protein
MFRCDLAGHVCGNQCKVAPRIVEREPAVGSPGVSSPLANRREISPPEMELNAKEREDVQRLLDEVALLTAQAHALHPAAAAPTAPPPVAPMTAPKVAPVAASDLLKHVHAALWSYFCEEKWDHPWKHTPSFQLGPEMTKILQMACADPF